MVGMKDKIQRSFPVRSTDSDDSVEPSIKQAVAALLAGRTAIKHDHPEAVNLRLVSYEITREPLTEGNPPETPGLAASYERLHPGHFDPEQWPELLSQLEALHKKFPDDAKIGNYLAALYSFLGRHADVRRTVQDLYRRHPDYLFAITAMIRIHINHDELKQAGEVLKNRCELSLLYPDRKIFHISEFVAFYSMIVRYHIARGAMDEAQSAFQIFQKVAPDHPDMEKFQRIFQIGRLKRDLGRLSEPKRRSKSGRKTK